MYCPNVPTHCPEVPRIGAQSDKVQKNLNIFFLENYQQIVKNIMTMRKQKGCRLRK